MISLKDFAGSLERVEVLVRGRQFSFRALTLAETDALRASFDVPLAPRVTAGGRVHEVATDPRYVKAHGAYLENVVRAKVAASLGWLTASGREFSGKPDKEWAAEAIGEVAASLTEADLVRVFEAMRRLDAGAVEDAEGK